jgi:hypothetical protein
MTKMLELDTWVIFIYDKNDFSVLRAVCQPTRKSAEAWWEKHRAQFSKNMEAKFTLAQYREMLDFRGFHCALRAVTGNNTTHIDT